ncbi:hypothetical protein [Tenacibaculum ascidiaceicola]|uniref:hypothetical protein n=1 Tax=Tenacibaculum ascidiaceicola TaxID=1699411 RepID=UPI003895B903
MKSKITVLLLLISILSFGQKKDSVEIKKVEFVEKLTYAFASQIFKKQEYNSKIDENYKFPWKTQLYTDTQYKTALDTLIKNATIKIKKGSFSNHILEFNSYFPEFMSDNLIDIFKLSIKKNKIVDGNTILKIQENGSHGFGFHSSSSFENGNNYTYNWRTINSSFNIKSKIKKEELKGAIEFESGFVKGYDYLKIKKSDIGKLMKIGNHEFTVIDILNNSVILDFKTNVEDLKFTLINVNKKNQRITSSGGMFTYQTLFEDMYLKFKENPNLSFEDYKKAFHPKYVELIKNVDENKKVREDIFGKEYKVFLTSGKLINTYLYTPKYFSRTFEITYDENTEKRIPKEPKKSSLDKKLELHFEKEEGIAVLLGDNLKLLDDNLKPIKSVKAGINVKIIGKTYKYFNGKKYDETCDAYKYVKIEHEGKEYLIRGKNVYKIKKLDKQAAKGSNLEFFKAEPNDFLKVLKPDEDMEFCYQIKYSPIIIRSIEKNSYSLINVIKDDLYSKITSQFKEADFFQSGSNEKIYNKITHIEIVNNGFLLDLRHNGNTYKISLIKKKNKYIAKYLE